jgi:hypothetical protein
VAQGEVAQGGHMRGRGEGAGEGAQAAPAACVSHSRSATGFF